MTLPEIHALFSQYSFSDCYFIDITMVSCACTVGIFMGVSRRFVSVLRANMKAKPRQLEHRTSDEIRMLFVPSGVRTAHAGKGKNSFLFTLCSLLFPHSSLLFPLYSAHHLHTICTATNNCNLIFYSYSADVHLFFKKHVIDDGVFQLYMKTPYSNS